MAKFKPGDVIIYGVWDPPSHAIVGESQADDGDGVRIIAFQHFTSLYAGKWMLCDSFIRPDKKARLHPDPDPVWADYCAWRLTDAAD